MKIDRNFILFTGLPLLVSAITVFFYNTESMGILALTMLMFFIIHLLDWGTTLDIADRPSQYYEASPITAWLIGKHPNRKDVHTFMLGSLMLTLVACALIGPLWANKLILVRVITSGIAVVNNFKIGLRLAFV